VAALRSKLEDHALPVLQGWYTKLREADQPHDACTVAAHLAFLAGGYAAESELDERAVFWLLSSRVFIAMHYGDLDLAASSDAAEHLAATAASAAARRSRRPSLADAQRGRSSSQPLVRAMEAPPTASLRGASDPVHSVAPPTASPP